MMMYCGVLVVMICVVLHFSSSDDVSVKVYCKLMKISVEQENIYDLPLIFVYLIFHTKFVIYKHQ